MDLGSPSAAKRGRVNSHKSLCHSEVSRPTS